MKTISIVNRKGGVGKTTTAIELSYILATSCGQRVLLIDADSQANATGILTTGRPEDGLEQVLRGEGLYYGNLITKTDVPGLDLLPATDGLSDLDMECLMGMTKPNLLAMKELMGVLAEDDAYDVVLIDCPPGYSLSFANAIYASDCVVIPTGVDAYSAVGMADLVRQIDSVRKYCPDVHVSGCLVTMWHRADVVEDAVGYLREEAPIHVFRTVIRRTDKVLESSWARQSCQQWSPFSAASRDYRAFALELMEREGMNCGQV